MPLSFKYHQFAPPGGKWFYTVEETGRYLEDLNSLDQLEARVRQHYDVNSIPVPDDLRARIEDYICRNVTFGFCDGEDPRTPDDMPVGYFDVTSAMEKFFRGGVKDGFVSTEDAVKRAGICIACKMNSLAMCTNCTGLRAQARRFVAGRRLDLDMRLGVCRVFRIPSNGLVHVKKVPVSVKPPPDGCWAVKKG